MPFRYLFMNNFRSSPPVCITVETPRTGGSYRESERRELRFNRISRRPGNNLFKSLPMSELQTKLGSSPDGLSQAEAQKRLTQYGPNEIAEKKTNEILNS